MPVHKSQIPGKQELALETRRIFPFGSPVMLLTIFPLNSRTAEKVTVFLKKGSQITGVLVGETFELLNWKPY